MIERIFKILFKLMILQQYVEKKYWKVYKITSFSIYHYVKHNMFLIFYE